MCDEWMPVIRLPLALEHFERLPRNPAYRYEYSEEQALLTPRPRFYHAVLDLTSAPAAAPSKETTIRRVHQDDWQPMGSLFASAFARWQPFGSLDDQARLGAAQQSLHKTRTGGDGPLIESACFAASECSPHAPREDIVAGSVTTALAGVILVTLLPDGDPCEWSSYYWQEEPPADLLARRQGRPHLTWIFVSPELTGGGVGTALLNAACLALSAAGYGQLYSTFLIGNDSSLLWHWRNGFRLLTHPGSPRRRSLTQRPSSSSSSS